MKQLKISHKQLLRSIHVGLGIGIIFAFSILKGQTIIESPILTLIMPFGMSILGFYLMYYIHVRENLKG